MRKGQFLQQMVMEQLDVHKQQTNKQNKLGHRFYAFHKKLTQNTL